jgi:hypothetical protein
LYKSKEFDLRGVQRSREYKVMNQKSPDESGSSQKWKADTGFGCWIPGFDESTGVMRQNFLVSPSRVGIVTSPADSRSVSSPADSRSVSSLAGSGWLSPQQVLDRCFLSSQA